MKNKNIFFKYMNYKLQNENDTIIISPGMNVNNKKETTYYIKVETERKTYVCDIRNMSFFPSNNEIIYIDGKNSFSNNGIILNINSEDINLKIDIKFTYFNNINSKLPKNFFRLGKVQYKIISLSHSIIGEVLINGKIYNFDKGIGYIELVEGRKMPNKLTYLQCNKFTDCDCSIIYISAKIINSFSKKQKSICVIKREEIEYVLISNKKITEETEDNHNSILYNNLKNSIVINVDKDKIKDNISGEARYLLWENNKQVIDLDTKFNTFKYIG